MSCHKILEILNYLQLIFTLTLDHFSCTHSKSAVILQHGLSPQQYALFSQVFYDSLLYPAMYSQSYSENKIRQNLHMFVYAAF